MSNTNEPEQKCSDSITDMYNEKNRIAYQITDMMSAFAKKYRLNASKVQITYNHAGCLIEVTI